MARYMPTVAFALMIILTALPWHAAQAQVIEKKVLSSKAARKIVSAAEAEVERNNWPGVIAVVDDAGWLILIERMDYAILLAAVELAPGKAWMAALLRKPSQALEDAINKGRVAATTSPFIEMKGGLPILLDVQVVGAIRVSADTLDHDVQIANAGLAVFIE